MPEAERIPNANSIVKMWLLKRGHPPMRIRTNPDINEIRLSWFAMDEWWPFCWIVDGKFYLGDDKGGLKWSPPEDPDFFSILEKRYNTKKEIARAYHELKLLQPNLLKQAPPKGAWNVDNLRKWIVA